MPSLALQEVGQAEVVRYLPGYSLSGYSFFCSVGIWLFFVAVGFPRSMGASGARSWPNKAVGGTFIDVPAGLVVVVVLFSAPVPFVFCAIAGKDIPNATAATMMYALIPFSLGFTIENHQRAAQFPGAGYFHAGPAR